MKLNGKRLHEIDWVKYLGIEINKNLTWKQFDKANAKSSKLRQILDKNILKSVLYVAFEFQLCYALRVWTRSTFSQKTSFITKIIAQYNVHSELEFLHRHFT